MQDIIESSINGSGGGEGFFGERRLRPPHHDVKCPRCHSLNTKFCYYNNYNLSQPRHFCKSCRRYWTKGGVLRNIPVGGGCRKTKRSKPKSNPSSGNSSHSAAANTTATAGIITTEVSPTLLNFQTSSTLDRADNNMFSEMDKFTSLMTSSTGNFPLPVTVGADTSSFRQHQEKTEEVAENRQQWIHEISEMGLKNRISDGGVAAEDWQGGDQDEALFDLTGAVDQSYWSQTQWENHSFLDQHL